MEFSSTQFFFASTENNELQTKYGRALVRSREEQKSFH